MLPASVRSASASMGLSIGEFCHLASSKCKRDSGLPPVPRDSALAGKSSPFPGQAAWAISGIRFLPRRSLTVVFFVIYLHDQLKCVYGGKLLHFLSLH